MNRLMNVGLVLLMIGGVATVYDMKFQGTEAKKGLAQLEADIAQERAKIALLRAEWSLLNQPQRLEQLARDKSNIFQLRVMSMDQITDAAGLDAHLESWTELDTDQRLPTDAVDPIGLIAQRVAAEEQ